ncbi:protein of unknown function [Azospirillum lipoferum 4B]|uniref:Uncharacterized protein n=1 Tax=Azospirillum lipoferum (strain 4B) TaxID=862719 RepID=G7Z879_AZOL4|nr:protein of unknown function [Azospirillum lipoferum 4B]
MCESWAGEGLPPLSRTSTSSLSRPAGEGWGGGLTLHTLNHPTPETTKRAAPFRMSRAALLPGVGIVLYAS